LLYQGTYLNKQKMITVQHLGYEYMDKTALKNVSFTIDKGSITALVGPNGAGKTTLMRCIAALQKPMVGEIYIDGVNILEDPHFAHRNIGYLSDFFGLYDDLSVRNSLTYIACSRIPDLDAALEKVEWAIGLTGVESFVEKEISKLSRGMRQRVGIAQAIIHNPKVLLLDEPASGLDPEARYALSNLLLTLNSTGITILVSSHILAELEDYSTEMLVLNNGSIAEKRALKRQEAGMVLFRVVLEHLPPFLVDALKTLDGINSVQKENNTLLISFHEESISRKKLMLWFIEQDFQPLEFGEHKINMQDEYLKTIREQAK
jgi:ABC-2 type transport system ATP-binding protein